jgi:hypothetical protein
MDARGGKDVRANQISERPQDCSAGPSIVGERGQRQIHALARIGFTLAIERLMEREFAQRIMAKGLGPARPLAITWKGAGAWLIFSHTRQVNFSRTYWITFH